MLEGHLNARSQESTEQKLETDLDMEWGEGNNVQKV